MDKFFETRHEIFDLPIQERFEYCKNLFKEVTGQELTHEKAKKYCKVECSARSGAINVEFKNLTIISRDTFDDFDNNWLDYFYYRNPNLITFKSIEKERAND